MASIDVIRNELNHVTAELAQAKKEEEKMENFLKEIKGFNKKLIAIGEVI